MEKVIRIMLVTLCLHLLYTNAVLLIAAQRLAPEGLTLFDQITLPVCALAYSLMSALCVFHLRKVLPVIIFGLMDGFAVYLRINAEQEHFLLIVAIFYGLYSALLFLFSYLLAKQNRIENEKSKSVFNENKNKKQNENKNELVLHKNKLVSDKNEIENENKNENENKIENKNQKQNGNETRTPVNSVFRQIAPCKDDNEIVSLVLAQTEQIKTIILAKSTKAQTAFRNLGIDENAAAPQPQPTLFD